MSDARSLLRQQRAAKRVTHPLAAYTDLGKLQCTLCGDIIRSGEAGWESHLRSARHKQKLQEEQEDKEEAQPQDGQNPAQANGKSDNKTETLSDAALLAQLIGGGDGSNGSTKRKLDDAEDAEDGNTAPNGDVDEASIRRKRSKHDISPATTRATPATPSTHATKPPSLLRRVSTTPTQGVELQIPSRPATPNAAVSSGSASSTPKVTPIGRSPLIPQDGEDQARKERNGIAGPVATFAGANPAANGAKAGADGGDDDDWAAFEAEVVNAPPTAAALPAAKLALSAQYSARAIVSSAPMTAEQIAKSEEDERGRRKAAAESAVADEKEDAQQALHDEFDTMEDLEARVKRLKEKRKALRRPIAAAEATKPDANVKAPVTEPDAATNNVKPVSAAMAEDSEDDEEEDDEDDWTSFRFRA